jgi:hypothetical protein
VSSTAPKADKAREFLEWCRYGHRKMRDDPTGLDWVLVWAGTIALLRAIGHALRTEDARSDPRLNKAQSAWLIGLKATKPDPHIFWEFIDRDRNRLLKEAELTVRRVFEEYLHEGIVLTDSFDGQQLPQRPAPRAPPPTSICTYQMKFGRFVGQDPRDLVGDAIEWWEKQLDDIEQKAAASSP